MSLQITFRPQKDLYVNNPPGAYDESYYNSRWVAGHLPIQYKISNTKYPENTDDDVDNICTVSDSNGFAQINLCGTYETYVKFEYIKIENSTVDSYNGVWQILDVVNSTTLRISAAYDGAATGTIQRYYNNYHNLVKVYAGIPSYHQYDSEDPMSLIATLKIEPDLNNLSIADISGLIQAKLNCDNDRGQISEPNDLNAWTGFYIQYAESYDQSDGNEVTQFTSSYTTDNNDDCSPTQIIQNGHFTTNLNNWVNGSTGSDFVYDAGAASATKGSNLNSKYLYQQVDFLQGVTYSMSLNVTNNESNLMIITVGFATDTTLSNVTIILTDQVSGTENYNFSTTPSQDYPVFFVRVSQFGGTSAQKCTIDNVSATITDCTYYGFAINGTRQFQNTIGGNFGDYVQNYNSGVYLNKFLTYFDEPIWFNDLYFDLSTIIPKSTFDQTDEDLLFYSILEYTSSRGFLARQDIELESKDDGVYRLPVSDLTLNSQTEEFDIQIYRLPQNILTDGNYGTFEYTADPGGTPPSDWLIGGDTTLSRSSTFARSGTYSLKAEMPSSVSTGLFVYWGNQTGSPGEGDPVTPNSDYVIEGYVLKQGPNLLGGEIIYVVPIVEGNILPYTVVESYTISSTTGVWNKIKTIFNTGAYSNIELIVVTDFPITYSGIINLSFYFDDFTIKGPIENISEVKTIKVDNSCTKQNIYLTWLNNLGAWEYYNFKAEKEYSVEVSESKKITRDIFNNWDTGFINGETQDDYISVDAFDSTLVRSQFITLSELQAVSKIKYAIRAQQIRDDDTKITVLVDKSSFKVYSDGDKLYQLEFKISYPNIQIQKQ